MNRWNGMRKAGSAWSVCVCSALLITVIACGGGGGGGGSTSASGGGSGGTFTEVAVEFRTPDNYAVDPSNIRVGDTLQMYLWGRDSTGQIGAVPSSNWSTTAPGSIAVTSSSGALRPRQPRAQLTSCGQTETNTPRTSRLRRQAVVWLRVAFGIRTLKGFLEPSCVSTTLQGLRSEPRLRARTAPSESSRRLTLLVFWWI